MSCHCSGCSRSKRIGTFRQLQEERCVRHRSVKKYPKRTQKIWDDRIKAQEEVVKRYTLWRDRALVSAPYGGYYGSMEMHEEWLAREVKQLEKIKLQAQKILGL